jgi:predicted outer membrane repeat protein
MRGGALGNNYHGFIRDPGGTFTSFDAPGSHDTYVSAINSSGVVVGNYWTGSGNQYHGFIRDALGNIATFDPPGSVSTGGVTLNNPGQVAGSYTDGGGTTHGFIGDPGGIITSFDPSDSLGTFVFVLTDSGTVAGDYRDASQVHSFIRDADGGVTTFDPPGSVHTSVKALTDSGVAAGFYSDGVRNHGFIRDADGGITLIDFPDSIGTLVYALNDSGQVAGSYQDSTGMFHGFLAAPNPEPSTLTLALLGVGTAVLAAWRRVWSGSGARGRAKSSRPNRPRLEALEDRSLLSLCTVDRLTDNNPTGGGEGSGTAGDLRWCSLESLFRADTINFSVTGTINLAAALPTLTRSTSIEGPGPNLLTVRRDTGGDYRIFSVDNNATVTISGLAIRNGHATSSGGGIRNAATLTINNCIISENSTAIRGDGGGGIYNYGSLTITASTITRNSASGSGGGIRTDRAVTVVNSTVSGNSSLEDSGGGIAGSSLVTLLGSTVSGNSALGSGGGIYGDATLVNSTVSGNTATAGGGINGGITARNRTISGNSASLRGGGIDLFLGSLTTRNTIIAGNTAPSGPDVYGNFVSQGHNLIGNPQDATGYDPTDIVHVNPLLGSLQDNGGPTRTHALLAGSPALNAGDPAQLGVADQRGVVRSGGVNIGAYQASASAFVLSGLPDSATAGTPFDVTVTAVDPFGQTALGYTGTLTFSTSDTNPAVVLPADYPFRATDAGTHAFTGMTTLISAGSQTLSATDMTTSSITGNTLVTVNPATADHLLFLQPPTDTAAGQTINPAVTVAVVDQFGNVVTDDNADTVTLAIGTNPGGGTLSGTLTVAVVNGVATFGDLSIDRIGDGYTLRATATGLTAAESAAFRITA